MKNRGRYNNENDITPKGGHACLGVKFDILNKILDFSFYVTILLVYMDMMICERYHDSSEMIKKNDDKIETTNWFLILV